MESIKSNHPDYVYDPITKQVLDRYGWVIGSCETEEIFKEHYPNGYIGQDIFEDENHRNGDILTYETTDLKWILIFNSWYRPYDGNIHYNALVRDNGEYYDGGTCFITEETCLRPATEEEKQFLFKKMKEHGLKWDFDLKRVVKI